ncbi:MAG TPA: FtsW/RodA/SpoVE family cell cycle protein [Candidatus Saccharimonadaceae bacterium]|nr:FtsW/RodA/SpoVE family cell cycle protein [Candidatus Saccharimonadaceae bacterium]
MRDRGWNSGRSSSDVVRRHRPDYMIAIYTGILMLLGLVIIYAIGPQRANVLNAAFGSEYSDSYFFIKQFVSFGVALVAFIGAALIPYMIWVKHASKLLILGLAACVALALASLASLPIAPEINGATSWFNLGVLGSIQPAEILKFGLLAYLAVFLGKRMKDGTVNDVKGTLVPVGVVSALSLFFVIIVQRDLGTGISLIVIILTMLFIAGLNRKMIAFLAAGVVVLGLLSVAVAPHRIERVATFLQGDNVSKEDPGGYHIYQANIALGTGGLFGVGVGNSVQATGYLPESINDSVFAILGETFGFIGLMVLLALFTALLMRLLRVMDHLVDIRLKLLVAGVFGWFGAHVILNIAAMLSIFPLTGITLPLLSFGGTSMVFLAAALGLVFQLSRYTVHTSHLKEASRHENSGSRRRVGRTRYASRRSS